MGKKSEKRKQKIQEQQLAKTGQNTATKSRLSNKQTKSSIREFVEAIGVAFIAAIILRIFLIQAFRIPTGSMKDTLMVGDFLLVNKFIYGVRTPDRIPLTDIEFPFWRLPAFKQPERGNIIVFKWPNDESLDYIKRCVAVSGETIELKNGEVFVDGKLEGKMKKVKKKNYDRDKRTSFDYFEVKTDWGDEYTIRQMSDVTLPFDNYGPVRVPQKGDVIQFPLNNEYEWRAYANLIEHENHRFSRHGSNQVFIDGKPATSYTVQDDYYFMMGDNRDNSSDSRDWGFLPYENIVGEALIIYFSWDSFPNMFNLVEKIRWSRIGSIIR